MPRITSHEKDCEICLVGKYPRNSFKSHVGYKFVCVLHVVHSNIFGPLKVLAFWRNMRVIIFVYEFSRKTRLFFLLNPKMKHL